MATTDQSGHPALPPRKGDTAAPDSAAPGTSAGGASVSPVAVKPLTVPERAAAAVRRGGTAVLNAARELWFHPDRLLYVLWHGKPGSMAEHRAYMKSRAWVPPGMSGGPEKAVIIAGLLYHMVIARPLKSVAKTADAAADRPLRFLCLVALLLAVFLILAGYL